MQKNLKGEIEIMKNLGIKPNYSAIAREYGMDWRTVKKYCDGYEGKPKKHSKPSKLDKYADVIADKLSIRNITVKGVYEFMVSQYGISEIGSYTNFNAYVKRHGIRNEKAVEGHPRYEIGPGEQAQVDWKEDISIMSSNAEIFTINVMHVSLKFSRYAYLELSVYKRFEDVRRCLINSFVSFGGVPDELLFDNMSTVAITKGGKRPTDAIRNLAKDFGFKIRLCRVRSPETKGSVEARNKIIEWIKPYEGEFETLEDLTQIVKEINRKMNINIHGEMHISPVALFYKEKEYLHPLPSRSIIDQYLTPIRYKVGSDAMIRYQGNRYSVNPEFIGEDVSVEQLDDKLYVYYMGNLTTMHRISSFPFNYHENHYASLMEGKVKPDDMQEVVNNNLQMMDKLLDSRKVAVTALEAAESENALIAYFSQYRQGNWIVTRFAHLSAKEKELFVASVNEVLPYVEHGENFVSEIQNTMKSDCCKRLAFNCICNDILAAEDEDTILDEKGYKTLFDRYFPEIDEYMSELRTQTLSAGGNDE